MPEGGLRVKHLIAVEFDACYVIILYILMAESCLPLTNEFYYGNREVILCQCQEQAILIFTNGM